MIGTNLSIFSKIPLNLSGGGAGGIDWGNFSFTELDSTEFDDAASVNDSYPWAGFMIDETHLAILYRDASVLIQIFEVNADYTLTYLNYKVLTTSYGGEIAAELIDATHFIIAFKEYSSDGFIETYAIDPDDNYSISPLIDSIEHDTGYGRYNSLAKVDDTHFLLAYSGGNNLKVFSVDGSYGLTNVSVLNTGHGVVYNDILKMNAANYIHAGGVNGSGIVSSINLDGAYGISETDYLAHSTENSNYYNRLGKIDDNHFMLAYYSIIFDGSWLRRNFIKVFSIDSSYNNITAVDELIISDPYLSNLEIHNIDNSHFFISGLESGQIVVKVIEIAEDFSISVIKSLTVDANGTGYTKMITIDETHFAFFYSGADEDGYYKVYEIS